MIQISPRTYRLSRVFVAIALLVGANASLLQVVCEETGEALTTSAPAVMMGEGGTGTAPCGLHSEDLHDRLCPDRESEHVCEEEGACSTETIESPAFARTDLLQVRGAHFFPSHVLPFEDEGRASRLTADSPAISRGDWATRVLDPVPLRLRTLSLRL